jgi:hypothetical protein
MESVICPRNFRGLAGMCGLRTILAMSRRSRKRSGSSLRSRIFKWSLALAGAGVLVLVVSYMMLRRYLHSDGFRKFLSAEVCKSTRMVGEFGPFRWVGLAVECDSFAATGAGSISEIRADSLHTEVSLAGVRRGVWEIQGSSLERLEIAVDTTKPMPETLPEASEKAVNLQQKIPGWLPKKAELQEISINELALKVKLAQGLATADGVQLRLSQAGAAAGYRAEAKNGTIRLPFKQLPAVQLKRIVLRSQAEQVFLTSAELSMWEKGRISATGEYDLKSRRFACEGEATGMTCNDVFSENWAKRLTGEVASTFTLDNHKGAPLAAGKLNIDGGVLTALPMLDALAAYADTRRFRILALSEAHTRWRMQQDVLVLNELVLASDGLVRLEGNLQIRGEAIEGDFRLGLAPGTLARIPGAETDVFALGERGLLWTPLRITGTLDHPKEDLTDRLIAAAGLRMLEQIPGTGEKVLRFSRSVIGDHQEKVIEKGLKAVEQGSEIIHEVSGVLDSLLGPSPEPVTPKP